MSHLLALLALTIACISGVPSPNVGDVIDLSKDKMNPAFSARSIEIRGNTLICELLEPFDAGKVKEAEKTHSRVLIFCGPWDAFSLSTGIVSVDLQRGAPGVGQERPGVKFLQTPPAIKNGPVALLKPARLIVVVIDERAKVILKTETIAQELQMKQ
jgi:hypothetical protein